MKMKLLLMVIPCLFMAIPLMAQRPKTKKFSIQLNTGYTWFSGKKYQFNSGNKVAYGSFINGQIPIEVEFRYKITPRFSLGVAYSYGVGIPYHDVSSGGVGVDAYTNNIKTNLSTHTIRIGEEYYFILNNKIRPYIGLDIGVFISQLTQQNQRTVNGRTTARPINYQTITTFGLFPKIGFESNLSKNLFLNVAVHYALAVPVDILAKGTNVNPVYPISSQVPSHGVTATVGLGYRF